MKRTTDKQWRIEGLLTAGTYVLRLGGPIQVPLAEARKGTPGKDDPQTGTDTHYAVRNYSNRASQRTGSGGTEVQTVDIEMTQELLPGKDPGTTITIEKYPGRITGRVTKVESFTTTASKKDFLVKGILILTPAAPQSGRQSLAGPNDTNVIKATLRDQSTNAVIASATTNADQDGIFTLRMNSVTLGNSAILEIFIPEVGDEVLVSFIHGDMRQPIILGGLYNGQDKPPSDLTAAPNSSQTKQSSGEQITRATVVWTCFSPPCPTDVEILRILDGLQSLVRSAGKDKALKENVKAWMKQAGASEKQIAQIFSQVGINKGRRG